MEWSNDIQQTGFKACVAGMKCRVNIPGGLYKPLPSVSLIASISNSPLPGLALCCTASLTFIVGYFILCREETESVCAACPAGQEGVWWKWDQDSPLLLAEGQMDF